MKRIIYLIVTKYICLEWSVVEASTALYLTIIFLVIASFPAVIWFFRFRKTMIKRQSQLARYLEDEFRPRDKTYWLLGYLVGFRARYTVQRGLIDNVHILYITPPYHVFFYLPIIALFKKRERLDVIIRFREGVRMGGIAHIADTSIRTIKAVLHRDMGDRTKYREAEEVVAGRRYKAYYTSPRALEIARRILREASLHARIYRVTVDGTSRTIMISFEPGKTEEVRKVLKVIWGILPDLREKPSNNQG